jgi:hypothetical protein
MYETRSTAGRAILAGGSALLLGATLVGAYRLGQRSQSAELSALREEMKTELTQARSQYEQLAVELHSLSTARNSAAAPTADVPQDGASAPAAQQPRPTVVRVPPSKRRPTSRGTDPRVKKLEAQLSEQQRQIAGTQEQLKTAREQLQSDLNSTRDQLQSNLSSTRDQLNGSIARNHDELVLLQKKGERNYYEFDIAKSKEFQRTGPVSLQLRKADTKRNRFDLAIMVNDAKVEKKNVNLYEPVLIYLPTERQPLELVVNQVAKNDIKGYVSELKYKKADLAAAAAAPLSPQPELKSR